MTRRSVFTLIVLLTLPAFVGACMHRGGSHHRRHEQCRVERLQTERTRQLAYELFEALNAADTERLDKLYAEDFTLWTAGSSAISGTSNKQEALAGMNMIAEAFPDGIVFGITAMTVEKDRAAIEAVSNGVHASGRPYHNEYHFLMVARDDRIVAFREYMDTMHAADVLLGGAR